VRGERTPAGLLATLLVAVIASGIAAAAVRGSDHASRSTAAVTTAPAPGTATTVSSTQPAQASQAAVAAKAASAAAAKAAVAKPAAHPARRVTTGKTPKRTLPYTGPSPIGPTVGLGILLLAVGAWALGAPRPRWMMTLTAIDRLRARGRYRPAR
jgi:hypothetical protein